MSPQAKTFIARLSELSRKDTALVGGKNASLGEMISGLKAAGVRVPGGFAVTAAAYRAFIAANDLHDAIARELTRFEGDADRLADVGRAIREAICAADLPSDLCDAIIAAYKQMEADAPEEISVAVRSSATAEDLPEASFAGQLETFLNVRGETALLGACKQCFASLYTDRAIAYRRTQGFDQMDIAVSVGVQLMVRSDLASSGVMFSIDTDSGFPNVVLINGAWGLGETVVQGKVDPDEFEIFKPLLGDEKLLPVIRRRAGRKLQKLVYAGDRESPLSLIDTTEAERSAFVLNTDELLILARWAATIERHYGQPMDMEWAKDGATGDLFIVQARPETVQSRRDAGAIRHYRLTGDGERLLQGAAIGDAIAQGDVCRIASAENISEFRNGAVLVTEMTDPDWVPIMKKAAAIVTEHGGRTSHAAIVSRELGLPAIVGASGATTTLKDGQSVTVSCAEGDVGFVYDGLVAFESRALDISKAPETRTRITLNIANPAAAFRWWRLPSDGAGLVRIEFIISNVIKAHPMAIARFDDLEDEDAREEIAALARCHASPSEYFIDQLAQGVARIAAAHYPKPVIVRLSDFKTNEYASLVGGRQFEPAEDNPMLGWRGASRYYHQNYRAGFALECQAMKRVRDDIGLSNVRLMVPFCRTLEEADHVLAAMREHGLKRGEAGLEVYVMAELPSNIILARQFAERFDGFSIGSNDLTQLTLGIDRDSALLKTLFDERDDAVKSLIASLIETARDIGAPVGICGQAPSDYPEFAQFLVERGIGSISVNPDRFLAIKDAVAAIEAEIASH